jgi:hypothetical protein
MQPTSHGGSGLPARDKARRVARLLTVSAAGLIFHSTSIAARAMVGVRIVQILRGAKDHGESSPAGPID